MIAAPGEREVWDKLAAQWQSYRKDQERAIEHRIEEREELETLVDAQVDLFRSSAVDACRHANFLGGA